jgi:H+/Cl- antiporter ClcA
VTSATDEASQPDEADRTAMVSGEPRSILARIALATIAVGLTSGLAGTLVSLLLRAVQHVGYAYPTRPSTFLDAVMASSPTRRFVALFAAGLIAAFGWWALDRYGSKRVTIERALEPDALPMPVATTVLHALLQVVTVALGSPLGREVAPREIGAAIAGWLARRARLEGDDVRVLLACGAGAGFAAVYNVPVAGVLFTMEGLLRSWVSRSWVPAIVTASIATGISRLVLGNETQYAVPPFPVDASLLAWSVVAGPILGLAAFAFRRGGAAARPRCSRHDARTIVTAIVVFAAIGCLAGPFPALLGNGKGPAQVSFDGDFGAGSSLIVLALKVVVVFAAIRAGAYGGLLTPGIACGALLATALGDGWSLWWAGPHTGAYALVGATVFLSVSMAMPLTAIVLLFEMTAMAPVFVVPIGIGVIGATVVARLCARRWP